MLNSKKKHIWDKSRLLLKFIMNKGAQENNHSEKIYISFFPTQNSRVLKKHPRNEGTLRGVWWDFKTG